MAGDIIVNIYGGGCGKHVDARQHRDYERTDCIKFASGFPRCNEDCTIEAEVDILDTSVVSVEFSIVLIGVPFSFCFMSVPLVSGTKVTQTFFCLFCGGTYRIYARGLDANGGLVCEISATVTCSGFIFEAAAREEVAAFKKKAQAKRKELDDAILAEGKQLMERVRSKTKHGAR